MPSGRREYVPKSNVFGTDLTPNETPKNQAVLRVLADDDFSTLLIDREVAAA